MNHSKRFDFWMSQSMLNVLFIKITGYKQSHFSIVNRFFAEPGKQFESKQHANWQWITFACWPWGVTDYQQPHHDSDFDFHAEQSRRSQFEPFGAQFRAGGRNCTADRQSTGKNKVYCKSNQIMIYAFLFLLSILPISTHVQLTRPCHHYLIRT